LAKFPVGLAKNFAIFLQFWITLYTGMRLPITTSCPLQSFLLQHVQFPYLFSGFIDLG